MTEDNRHDGREVTRANTRPWELLAAIPGVNISQAFDGGDLSVIGDRDPRYIELRESHPNAGAFLGKFQTPFGVSLVPSLIVCPRGDRKIESFDVSSIRNIVAICHVLNARVDANNFYRPTGILFDELFDIYPITLTTDCSQLYLISHEAGVHQVEAFVVGQPTGSLYPQNLDPDPDSALKTALLALWCSEAATEEALFFRTRILRSLAAACHAMRNTPSRIRAQVDLAIPRALWITAFEVLAKPVDGKVEFRDVSRMIKDVPWLDSRLRRKLFRAIPREGEPSPGMTTLPVQVYGRLWRLRNRVLHGTLLPERVDEPDREPWWGNLEIQGPALYRGVLLSLLGRQGFGRYPSYEGFEPEDFPALMETRDCENALIAKKREKTP